MFVRMVLSLVLVGCLGAPAFARTVAVAPLVTSAADEYQWVGTALAHSLALRVHEQPDLNGITLRQINAAMRQDRIEPSDVHDTDVAWRLGRQLGADVLIVGTYTARWPDIEVSLKLVDPQRKKVTQTRNIKGGLDDLLSVESRTAEALASALGAKKPKVGRAAFGTESLRAWRSTTLALQILNWQSLSPRAADAGVPLRLPAESIAEAERLLGDATRLDEDYGEAWAGLGVARALAGKSKEAWAAFGKATALGSGHNPTAVLGASFVKMRAGAYPEAVSILSSALGRHPGFTHARGYLGELYNHMGQQREALAVWNDYVKAVPKQPWVLARRGYTKARLGDHAGALADTQDALRRVPKSPALLLELASRYVDAKKLVGAEDTLRHALKEYPTDSRMLVRLGYVFLLQGKDKEAIDSTNKALHHATFGKNRRNIAYAHLNLARAHGHRKELDEAFKHLQEVSKNGTISFFEIEDDPKLEAMRNDPRYAKLNP